MPDPGWHDLGPLDELRKRPLQTIAAGHTRIALSFANGRFGAIGNGCNHVGGPLGAGTLDGEYVVCPWHAYKFHRLTGAGEPGFEDDRVPGYELREQDGRLWLRLEPVTRRHKKHHPPHALERPLERAPGPVRVLGLSTTVMDRKQPRYSTSEALLEDALAHARETLGLETQLLRARDLSFRSCEGYYSKSARACTWPCSITQMDPADQMERVYEALVFWADVVLIATPIRWGSASSLWFQLAERLNCVQNQVTLRDRVLLRNKVAAFVITGGQDNVQAVAGQLLMFCAELGFHFPQFPFVAHIRGWTAEDMERNVEVVQRSGELRDGARALLERGVALARLLLAQGEGAASTERAGRKANPVGLPPLGQRPAE